MFNLKDTDRSWQPLLSLALEAMDPAYLEQLSDSTDWLPGPHAIFNAFKLPIDKTRYILFGESPYPRAASANGYAFWDARVEAVWSDTGLTATVNRATSLRNLIKMLLLANGDLTTSNLNQATIAQLNKSNYIATLPELFQNLLAHGFLLLNTTLVLSQETVATESRYWHPFIQTLLSALSQQAYPPQLILLGKVSEKIRPLADLYHFDYLLAEHPYNISFITNRSVLAFFKPLNLLKKNATVASIGIKKE
jgi:uracil-DNA glycosylase